MTPTSLFKLTQILTNKWRPTNKGNSQRNLFFGIKMCDRKTFLLKATANEFQYGLFWTGCILLNRFYGCGFADRTQYHLNFHLSCRSEQNTSTAAVRDLPLRSWAPLWSALRHHWEERCLWPPLPSVGGAGYPTVSPRVCPAPWWSTWESIHSNWGHLRCNNHITYII